MNKNYFFQRVLLEKYFFLLNSCYGNKIWHYIYFDIDDDIKIQYKTRFINKLFKKYWFHFFHNNNCNNFSLYFNPEDWDYLWIAKDNNLSDLYHNIFNWIYNNLWESILKNILRRKKIKTEFWKVILITRKNYIQYNWIYFKFPCEKRYIDEISNSSCPEFIKDWDKKYAFNFNWFYDLIVKYYEDISKYKYTEQFIKSNIIKIISYLLFLKDIEEFRTEKFENIDKKILSKINFNEIKFYNNENIEKINKERSIEEEIKNMVVIWNAASNNADFGTLEKILGDKIDYYQSLISRDYYIADQKRFFQKNPVYSQRIVGNIIVTQLSDNKMLARFVKEVSTRKETKEYPSYLAFENINGSWKLVVESDTVSDANIARMKQRKNNTQEKVQEQQPAIITPNQSQYYYGSSVKLVGTITRRKYQNPDNSVANVFLLRLSTPITVIGNTEDSPTERNVQEIQLMGNETISLFDKDVVGKKVQITGELFHLHTGHHYTQVLILVSNINFLN